MRLRLIGGLFVEEHTFPREARVKVCHTRIFGREETLNPDASLRQAR